MGHDIFGRVGGWFPTEDPGLSNGPGSVLVLMFEIVLLMVTVGAETSWAIEFASPGSLCYSNEVRSSSGASRWPRAKSVDEIGRAHV